MYEAVFLIPKQVADARHIHVATTSTWWAMIILSELHPTFRLQPQQIVSLNKVDALLGGWTHFVYVDDAMYSGKQTRDVVSQLCVRVIPPKKVKLFVVVPYVTRVAIRLIESELARSDRGAYVELVWCHTNIIQTTGECVGQRAGGFDYMSRIDDPEHPLPPTMVYFDHKFPDILSTDQVIKNLLKCNDEAKEDECIVPPYKNRVEPDKNLYFTQDILYIQSEKMSELKKEFTFYIMPYTWDEFRSVRIPPHVKWSQLLVPGEHELYASKLPKFSVFRQMAEGSSPDVFRYNASPLIRVVGEQRFGSLLTLINRIRNWRCLAAVADRIAMSYENQVWIFGGGSKQNNSVVLKLDQEYATTTTMAVRALVALPSGRLVGATADGRLIGWNSYENSKDGCDFEIDLKNKFELDNLVHITGEKIAVLSMWEGLFVVDVEHKQVDYREHFSDIITIAKLNSHTVLISTESNPYILSLDIVTYGGPVVDDSFMYVRLNDPIYSIAATRDGGIACGRKSGMIALFYANEKGRFEVSKFLYHGSKRLLDLAVAGDGRLVSASTDNTVKVWNVQARTCDLTISGPHMFGIRRVAIGKDDILYVSSMDDTNLVTVRKFNLSS